MRARRLAVLLAAAAALPSPARAEDPVKLTDVFITMDDGVRLAADVYLPPGTPADGSVRVPCLVELTPYRKESRAAEGLSFLPPNGFGLIEVDARGTGGSEGEYDIVFSVREQHDAAAVVEWAGTQAPWCTDRVGMFGGSYSGIIQYLVASLDEAHRPPHLAAIAPQRAYGDLYRDIVYHGGQLIGSFGLVWSTGTTAFYTQPPSNVLTPGGQRAWADHLGNNDPMMLTYLANPYADAGFTWTDGSGTAHSQRLYEDSSILPRIENLRVPALHLAGWFDSFTRGQLLTFRRALALERQVGGRGPNYLIVGPWNHAATHFVNPPNFTDRLLDWYRYWLAGGPQPAWFGDDRRVHYFLVGSGGLNDATGQWRDAPEWPPPGVSYGRLYLHGGGRLDPGAPVPGEPPDAYLYDPATGLGEFPSRWDNAAAGAAYSERDQRPDEAQGLTFSTGPLDAEVRVAGPILLRLWAATTGLEGRADLAADWPGAAHLVPPYHDTDFVVKLSDVAPDGTSKLVTAGYLRASHRAVDLGRSELDPATGEVVVPHHPHTLASLQPPPPGAFREYLIEIWPAAKTFLAGHRLRITISSADSPNHLNLLKPALNEVAHDPSRPSYLLLPFVPA